MRIQNPSSLKLASPKCKWENAKTRKENARKSQYPDRQTVLRVCEEGNPYSIAFSSSSLVAVTLLTGGALGLGAETTSY